VVYPGPTCNHSLCYFLKRPIFICNPAVGAVIAHYSFSAVCLCSIVPLDQTVDNNDDCSISAEDDNRGPSH